MALNSNIILQGKSPDITLPDPMAQYGKALQLKGLMTQNQVADQSLADDQATRQAYQNSDGNPQSILKSLITGGNYKAAQSYQKQLADQAKTTADTNLSNSKAAVSQSDLQNQTIARYRDLTSHISNADDAAQWLTAQYNDPTIGKILQNAHPLDQALASIPKDPIMLNQWIQKQALGQTDYIKQNKPTYQTSNLGGKTVTTALPGLGGPVTTVNSQANSVSPDAVLSANTSRANNSANIAKDFTVAGINPDGSTTGDTQSVVDAIGQYKVAPPNGMALRNPRMQSILAQVAKQYPDFDATQYGARQQAAKSFSTGKDGQAVQSANTALNHLDTLKQLADAQNNGDIPLFNKIANKIATETGQAAPTNLKGAITMVGPEISKAVVGAGGTGGDREKVDSALQAVTNGSGTQSSGQIATMQDLFGGRLTEAQRTYQRTTGRDDFAKTFLSPAAQAVLAARQGSSGQPNAAQGSSAAPTTFASLPDPATLSGKRIQGPDGKVMISNGKSWILSK